MNMKKWFVAILKDPDTTAYMAYYRKERIGSIRFEANETVIKTSIMLNPLFLGKGLGLQVIKMGIEKFIKEEKPGKSLIAEIKKDNLASIKTFQKAGFKKAGFKEDHSVYIYNQLNLAQDKTSTVH
jgi:L-amino acid N-acyltransferase YncA